MTDIPPIAWILIGFWLSVIALMSWVMYVKIKKYKRIRRRKCFKLIKGENVE